MLCSCVLPAGVNTFKAVLSTISLAELHSDWIPSTSLQLQARSSKETMRICWVFSFFCLFVFGGDKGTGNCKTIAGLTRFNKKVIRALPTSVANNKGVSTSVSCGVFVHFLSPESHTVLSKACRFLPHCGEINFEAKRGSWTCYSSGTQNDKCG